MTKIEGRKLDFTVKMWDELFLRSIKDGVSIEYSEPIKISDGCSEKGIFKREMNIKLMFCEDKEHNIKQIIEDGLMSKPEDRTYEID